MPKRQVGKVVILANSSKPDVGDVICRIKAFLAEMGIETEADTITFTVRD